MQQRITRAEAAKMFSGSNVFLNMFLVKYGLTPDSDDLFDRKTIEKYKADRRTMNLEMDFVEFRSQARTSSEVYGKSFVDHGEAVYKMQIKLNRLISEVEAVAAIAKLPTYRRNGSKLYYLGDIYEAAYKLIMAPPPVKVPLSPDAKRINKRSKIPASV